MRGDKLMKNRRKTNWKDAGITLVALVVTIIVLLILAGTSISMIIGDKSLMSTTKKAQKTYDTASIIEQIQLAVIGSQNTSGYLNASDISSNIKQSINGVEIEGNEKAFPLILSISDEYYIINADGNIKKVDGSLKSATFPTGSNLRGVASQFIKIDKIAELNPDLAALIQGAESVSESDLAYARAVVGTGMVESFKQFTGTEEEAKEKGTEIQTGDSEGKIYVWFEPSTGKQVEVWDLFLSYRLKHNIIVEPGTLYWWSDADLVLLNQDCGDLFASCQNLKDISGLRNLITTDVVNMDNMFARMYFSS